MKIVSSLVVVVYNIMSSELELPRRFDRAWSLFWLSTRARSLSYLNIILAHGRIDIKNMHLLLSESQRPSCVSRCSQYGLYRTSLCTSYERDSESQDCLRAIHGRAQTANKSGHFIFMLSPLDPFSLAQCHTVFSSTETNQNVLLNLAYVALHM